ncbi:MAG: carboxypeptidase regulatory-like domain-containing protein, partial [Acidobacteria bacterium]|nr:carboxypeptidase regulatory-like domain-containing protein [Acidobacteriota bacterium]
MSVLAVSKAPVFAQSPVTGGFEGKVREKGTGTPLAGAVVEFINNANGFQTAKRSDQNGDFRQNTLQPGVYLIRVTLAGYKTKEKSQELYATRSNALVPVPVELEKEETVAVVTT